MSCFLIKVHVLSLSEKQKEALREVLHFDQKQILMPVDIGVRENGTSGNVAA